MAIWLAALCLVAVASAIEPLADIENKDVKRDVDLSTHLVKVHEEITFVYKGNAAQTEAYVYAVEPSSLKHLSFVGATQKTEDEVATLRIDERRANEGVYRILLAAPAKANVASKLTVTTIFTSILEPYPAEITQSERQFIRFTGNVYSYSVYRSEQQSTVVTLATANALSYSQLPKPVSKSDTKIEYGPYKAVAALSSEPLQLHFENNAPFLAVASYRRTIEISHWGNIAIEEQIEVVHNGARLRGPFSRYDYQRHSDGVSSVKSFKTILPATARDVYYRDEIGNISTSHLRTYHDHVALELRPRFPLFGGWKTVYTLGYNVPAHQYIFARGNLHALRMRFVDHVFDDQVVDSFELRIVLPEGVTDVRFAAPAYAVETRADELVQTYLDTSGRTIKVFAKRNLVEQHIQDFELRYNFNRIMMLREPFMVVAFLLIIFVTVIVYVRLDFSIMQDEAKETQMRLASVVEQLQDAHDKRSALLQAYLDAINKYKAHKDSSSFVADRKRIETDERNLTATILSLQDRVRRETSTGAHAAVGDLAERIEELQKLYNDAKSEIDMATQLAEKVMTSKLTREQYIDLDKTNQAKLTELEHKMDALLTGLAK